MVSKGTKYIRQHIRQENIDHIFMYENHQGISQYAPNRGILTVLAFGYRGS